MKKRLICIAIILSIVSMLVFPGNAYEADSDSNSKHESLLSEDNGDSTVVRNTSDAVPDQPIPIGDGSKQLCLGDYIYFGNVDGEAMAWQVIHLEDGAATIFESDINYTDMEYDASFHGQTVTVSFTRYNTYGSATWEYSDIRQWLNSRDDTVQFQDVVFDYGSPGGIASIGWDNDSPPSYSDQKGFLNSDHFSDAEYSILLDTPHLSLIPYTESGMASVMDTSFDKFQNDPSEYYYGGECGVSETTDRMFLLSGLEFHKYVISNGLQGLYFPNGRTYPGFWLRDSVVTNFAGFYYYYGTHALTVSDGRADSQETDLCSAVRPACRLNLSAVENLSGSGTLDDPYTLKIQQPVEIDDTQTVMDGKYCIHVVDECGNAVNDATVIYDGVSQQTDPKGNAVFDCLTIGNPVISVQKENYTTWTNQESAWVKDVNRYEIVVLYPTETGGCKLNLAYYSSSPISANGSSASSVTNILAYTKTLNLQGTAAFDLDLPYFYLLCSANDSSNVQRYQLWQNNNLISETETGVFPRLDVDCFSVGGGCFIRVVSKDGKRVDTKINLVFAENTVNKANSFSLLGKSLKITVKDSVPFLGGTTITYDLPITDLPISWYIGDDKTQIGINLAVDAGKPLSEQLNDYKKTLAKVSSYLKTNSKMSEGDRKILKRLVKNNNKADFFKKCTLTFAAYFEQSNGSKRAEGYIAILVKLDILNCEYNTVVGVIPVTVQVGADFTLETGVKGYYDSESGTLGGNIMLNPSASLKAFGGIGVSKYVGVGAYGSAALDIKYNLVGSESGLRNMDLTGELGLKAYVGPFTYQRPFAHNTWHLYSANNVNIEPSASLGVEEGLFDAKAYTPANLSYLDAESEWLGGATRSGGEVARTELTPLLTDTYRNAQPVMIATTDALYAAFVRADQETGERYVVMTRFDGSSWAEPVRADEAAILDDAPSLCADGNGNIWLAYSKAASEAGDSMLEYAENREIVVGRVDPDTLAFTPAKTYPAADGTYAHMQQLALAGGKPTLAWVASDVTDADSVLRPASGQIHLAVFDQGSWGDETQNVSVDSVIDSLTIGEKNGAAAVAYVSGETLYNAFSRGDTEVIAENVTGSVRFGTLPGVSEAVWFWNEENALHLSDDTVIPAPGISHEFAVVGDKIYFSAAEEGGAVLSVLPYLDGSWSLPMRLTGDARYLENLSAAALNGTDYVFGMNTKAEILADDVEDAKDLVWSSVQPVYDLRLDDVYYGEEGLMAGESVPVFLTVTNAGGQELTCVDVFLDDSWIGEIDRVIAPGGTAELETEIVCPAELTTYRISVSIPEEDDYTEENNSCDISIGYADAKVELYYEQIGQTRTLVAAVSNVGIEDASGTVSFFDGNGKEIAVSGFNGLASGDTVIVPFVLDEAFADKGGDVSVCVTLDQDELVIENNNAALYITKAEKNPFVDVHETDYFYYPVMWAISHDPRITAGVDDTHFGPNNSCTREQIVTFLWAANGKPEPAGTGSTFSDVAADAWYYKPVMWAVENGYTSGMGDGSFGVGQSCTRAQAMTFLWAANGKTEPESEVSPFSDVTSGDWFCKPILWAAEHGVTAGIGGGLFGVNNTCTRAQIITFLYKVYAPQG